MLRSCQASKSHLDVLLGILHHGLQVLEPLFRTSNSNFRPSAPPPGRVWDLLGLCSRQCMCFTSFSQRRHVLHSSYKEGYSRLGGRIRIWGCANPGFARIRSVWEAVRIADQFAGEAVHSRAICTISRSIANPGRISANPFILRIVANCESTTQILDVP